jgi:hypothetical protein
MVIFGKGDSLLRISQAIIAEMVGTTRSRVNARSWARQTPVALPRTVE